MLILKTLEDIALNLFIHVHQIVIKKHFIFNRIVNSWNSLPDNVFNTNIIKSFRNRISACMF